MAECTPLAIVPATTTTTVLAMMPACLPPLGRDPLAASDGDVGTRRDKGVRVPRSFG